MRKEVLILGEKLSWKEKILILEQLRKVRPPLKKSFDREDPKKYVHSTEEQGPLFPLNNYDESNYFYYTEVKK